jgi:RNA polymerase sigma factor (sigma-70 family)
MIPQTPMSILDEIRKPSDSDARQVAWNRFAKLYAPVLTHWAKKTGLNETAADDVVAEIFAALAANIGKFRPERGKFRCWLKTVARNKAAEVRRRRVNPTQPMPEELADPNARDPAEDFMEKELFDHVMKRALLDIKPRFSEESWNCFWRHCIEGHSVADIAASTGKTPAAVWAIILCIRKRFAQEFRGMFDEE